MRIERIIEDTPARLYFTLMEVHNHAKRKLTNPTTTHRIRDAINQLRHNEGLMSTLGSENDVPKLDWVEGVSCLPGTYSNTFLNAQAVST